jgi:peroxiredoxin
MLTRKLLITTLFVLSLAFSAFSQSALRIGSVAPQFSGTSADGTQYDLAQLRGKVVVLTFWSTRCEVCRVEMPLLDRVVEQYDPKDVLFLALTSESDEKILPYLRTHPFRFATITNSFGTLLQYADRDRDGAVNMPYPSFFVLDPRGRVQYRASGYDKTVALNSAIRQSITVR